MIVVFGISNCDTVRKTRKWLEANTMAYRFHDFRKDGLDVRLAQLLLEQFGTDRLINRRGTTWRQLSETDKSKAEQQDTAITLIQTNPALIKRPVIQHENSWLLGFNENTMNALNGTGK